MVKILNPFSVRKNGNYLIWNKKSNKFIEKIIENWSILKIKIRK